MEKWYSSGNPEGHVWKQHIYVEESNCGCHVCACTHLFVKNSCLDLFLSIYSDSTWMLSGLSIIHCWYLCIYQWDIYSYNLSIHLVELDNIQREVLREAQGSLWLVRTFECVEFAPINYSDLSRLCHWLWRIQALVSRWQSSSSLGRTANRFGTILPCHAKSGTRPELMQIILNIS